MRVIDDALKEKLMERHQTAFNNADNHMEVKLLRAQTPINHKKYWQESIVATVQATASSTAVRRRTMLKPPDRAYVAYIYNSTLYVKSSQIKYPVSEMIWTLEEQIADVIDCALDFNGDFDYNPVYGASRGIIEFTTDELPYLFYVTTLGELKCGILGSSYETIVGANVSGCDAIRGFQSRYKDVDQGLIVFYILNGSIYYNSLLEGEWQGQQSVTIGPETVVSLNVERTFDWRYVIQVTDDLGALHEIFTKPYISGWAGVEHLTARSKMTVAVYEVEYYDTKSDDEHISAEASMSVIVLWGISPIPVSAHNIANGEDDYGYLVRLFFDHDVLNVAGNDTAFLMTDSEENQFNSTAIASISTTEIEITFQNFNNAVGEVIITYTPGTMLGEAGQAVEAFDFAFMPTGLVPFEVDPPVPLSIENIIDWSIT